MGTHKHQPCFCQRCTKQCWCLWVSVSVAQNNVGVYGFLSALHKTRLVFMGFCQRCTKQCWCNSTIVGNTGRKGRLTFTLKSKHLRNEPPSLVMGDTNRNSAAAAATGVVCGLASDPHLLGDDCQQMNLNTLANEGKNPLIPVGYFLKYPTGIRGLSALINMKADNPLLNDKREVVNG